MAKPGQQKYKRWRCPKCNKKYENPLPVFSVLCVGMDGSPHRGQRIEMKPEEDKN